MTRRSRLYLRAQSVALVLVLCALAGLTAWASTVWTFQSDWTWGHRNSLTAASRRVLAKLTRPATLTAFVQPGSNLAHRERLLLERYRRADQRIRVRFVNPDTAPGEMKKLGITTTGELYVGYGRRGEKLDDISESGITNALLRLARGTSMRVAFVIGHGESAPAGKRNFDFGHFTNALKKQGFDITTVNLATGGRLGSDTALVVIAGPQTGYLPQEVHALRQWVSRGGDLLWMHDPGPLHGLGPLARALGVKTLDGTVVGTTAHRLGINDPTALVLSHYGRTPVTQGFDLTTLFPDATGFTLRPADAHGWKARTFLHSRRLPASWLMAGTGRPSEAIYRPGTDTPGPIKIGIVLTRPRPQGSGQQRVAVIGNTSFLTNQFLSNGGNLNLGLRLFNWLTGQDRFVDISPVQPPDRTLSLSPAEQLGIGLGFLAGLPLLFLAGAVLMWLRRRRR